MAEAMEVVIAGEPMRLLADRALYWPARNRLLLADLHLGKADIFRRFGIALPSGGTRLDLSRIAFHFANHSSGALRELIDTVNSFVDE